MAVFVFIVFKLKYISFSPVVNTNSENKYNLFDWWQVRPPRSCVVKELDISEHELAVEIIRRRVGDPAFRAPFERPQRVAVIARRRPEEKVGAGLKEFLKTRSFGDLFDVKEDPAAGRARGADAVREKEDVGLRSDNRRRKMDPRSLPEEILEPEFESPVTIKNEPRAAFAAGEGQLFERVAIARETPVGDVDVDSGLRHFDEREEGDRFRLAAAVERTVLEIRDMPTALLRGLGHENEIFGFPQGEVGGENIGPGFTQPFELGQPELARIHEPDPRAGRGAVFHGVEEGGKIGPVVADDDVPRVSGTVWLYIA